MTEPTHEEQEEGWCWPCAISGCLILCGLGYVVWRYLL